MQSTYFTSLLTLEVLGTKLDDYLLSLLREFMHLLQ